MSAQTDARFAGEEYLRHIMLDYRQMTEFVKEPFVVAKADGIRFWDVYGKEYLDGLAGIFTVNGRGRRGDPTRVRAWPSLAVLSRAKNLAQTARALRQGTDSSARISLTIPAGSQG